MRLTENSNVRPRARFDLKRRCFQRGYVWPWILVIVIPLFLRLVMFYDITFLFQLSSSTSILTREELQLYSHPQDNLENRPITIDDVNFRDTHHSLVIRPDEDAGITHDKWISHATDSLKNEASQKRTEVERSTGRHLPVTKLPSDQDIDAVKGNEEGRGDAADKRIATEEKLANLDRVGEDMGADEERRIAKQMEAAPERIVGVELEVTDGKTAAEERESEDERKIVQGKEADVDSENAEERKVEEEMMITKEREADQEEKGRKDKREAEGKKAAEEREDDDQKSVEDGNAAQEMEVEEERKAGEQGEAVGQKEGEEKKPATDRTEAEEQGYAEEKNSDEVEEQKTADGQKESERAVKVEEATEETTHTDDQNQKEKEEEKREDLDPQYREDFTTTSDQTEGASRAGGECDLLDGDWEWDPEGPMYTNSTCFYIQGDHNCMSNGRQDTGFQSWRWKPRGCDLPRFDARAFLEAFKGKTMAFVGDSLVRNQMQSMLCLLSMVEVPIKIHDDPLSIRWLYEIHQVTLVAVWSTHLLKESQDGIMGFEKGQSVLYLDVLDPLWTSMLPDFDMIVFSVGVWYYKPSVYVVQDEVIGCNHCPDLNLTELSFTERYSEGLRKALDKVAADWKGIAIVSTHSAMHYESVNSEFGQCRRERPLEQEEYERSFLGMNKEMRDIAWGEFSHRVNQESKDNNDVHFEFLDVNSLTTLRADGHPGPFVFANPFEGKQPDELIYNDCLHWCLPGPVDTWNQLLVKIVQKHL